MLSWLILFVFATFRLTHLLSSEEEGPFEILQKLRHIVGVRYDAKGERYHKNELAKGLLCFWCCSVWVGGLLAVPYIILSNVSFWLWPVCALALSGAAIFIYEKV